MLPSGGKDVQMSSAAGLGALREARNACCTVQGWAAGALRCFRLSEGDMGMGRATWLSCAALCCPAAGFGLSREAKEVCCSALGCTDDELPFKKYS